MFEDHSEREIELAENSRHVTHRRKRSHVHNNCRQRNRSRRASVSRLTDGCRSSTSDSERKCREVSIASRKSVAGAQGQGQGRTASTRRSLSSTSRKYPSRRDVFRMKTGASLSPRCCGTEGTNDGSCRNFSRLNSVSFGRCIKSSAGETPAKCDKLRMTTDAGSKIQSVPMKTDADAYLKTPVFEVRTSGTRRRQRQSKPIYSDSISELFPGDDNGNRSNNNNNNNNWSDVERDATNGDNGLIRRCDLDRVRSREVRGCFRLRHQPVTISDNRPVLTNGKLLLMPGNDSKTAAIPFNGAAAVESSTNVQPVAVSNKTTLRRCQVACKARSPSNQLSDCSSTSQPENTIPIVNTDTMKRYRAPNFRRLDRPQASAAASPVGVASQSSAPMMSNSSAERCCCRTELPRCRRRRCFRCHDDRQMTTDERQGSTSRDRASARRMDRREKMRQAIKWLSECASVRCVGTEYASVDGCPESKDASPDKRWVKANRENVASLNEESGGDIDCMSKALEVFRLSLMDGDELLRLEGDEGDGVLHYDLLSRW